MNEEKTCLSCGGTNLEPGSLQSSGRLTFRPKEAKFLTTKFADVSVKTYICLDCGHIACVGDAEKVKSLVNTSSRKAVCPAGLS